MAVDATGTRVTELAERTKMTKQAVGELVSYLSQHGYVSIAPDATDRRAKQILLTARGWEAIEVGQRVIADFDRWLDTAVGAERVAQLREALIRIIETDPAER
jgi:DNA-binding MarR family transcriptional regulator